ncbi:hypothetical protein CR513_20840, partial [Mucuna pruriens]
MEDIFQKSILESQGTLRGPLRKEAIEVVFQITKKFGPKHVCKNRKLRIMILEEGALELGNGEGEEEICWRSNLESRTILTKTESESSRPSQSRLKASRPDEVVPAKRLHFCMLTPFDTYIHTSITSTFHDQCFNGASVTLSRSRSVGAEFELRSSQSISVLGILMTIAKDSSIAIPRNCAIVTSSVGRD